LCQKLSDLLDVRRSDNKNNLPIISTNHHITAPGALSYIRASVLQQP